MPLEADDLEQIKNLLTEQLKGLDQLVKTQVQSAVGDLDQRIQAAIPKPDKKVKPRKDDDVDLGDPVADEVARLRKMVEDREKALQEAELKAKTDRLHGAARDALAKHGVPADRIPVALAYLRDRLSYGGEQDAILGIRGVDRFGSEVVQPFDEAVPAFLKTTEGKLFVPPAGSAGTGTGAGRPSTSVNGTSGSLDGLLKSGDIKAQLAKALI